MSNLKYKHTAYTSAQWASLNPVIVENEIVIESDTKRTKIGNGISTYNELEYADANSIGNSLGSIKPTDAAPTPARNGNYTFSIGGNKPAWLTAEAGVTTVKAGDGVAVVYDGVSAYTYTHVNVSSDFVTLQKLKALGYIDDGITNDWYDPNFKHNYVNDIKANITSSQVDFAVTGYSARSYILDGENCMRLIIPASVLINLDPAFTRGFFTRLGYMDGDKLKVGFWLKVPDASPTNTRALYKGSTTYEETPITISSPDWIWYETVMDYVVNSNIWQPFYLGIRYGNEGEFAYLKGLTLTNITKTTWTGERQSKLDIIADSTTFLNLNPWVENIFEKSTILYTATSEQNGKTYTKEIITVPEFNNINGIRFFGTGAVGAEFRIILNLGLSSLNGIDRYCLPKTKGYLKLGLWLKTTQTQEPGYMILNNANYSGLCTEFFTDKGLQANKWHWIETPAIFLQDGPKSRNYSLQVLVKTANTSEIPTFDICGLTIGYVENPLAFRFEQNNIAKKIASRFYGLKYCSYGDSITAANSYQEFINKTFGCDHYLRGCGGSTMVNNGTYFWTNAAGEYLERPPANPPAGTEGVDYFTTDAGMCTQERVNTIPADTNFLTVLAGSNDWAQNVQLGSRTDAASDATNATFWAAWKSFFEKIQTRLPNAAIFICNLVHHQSEMTVTNSIGLYYYQYREVIQQVAQMYGYPCIELNDLGVTDANWTNYSSDAVHPNEKFHQLIGEKIAQKIIEYKQYDSVKNN